VLVITMQLLPWWEQLVSVAPQQWALAIVRSRCAADVQSGRPHAHLYTLMSALSSLAGMTVEHICMGFVVCRLTLQTSPLLHASET
jgi:hypothetical protein